MEGKLAPYVLLVQPNTYPKKISVGTKLEDLQAMVGGDIEVTYPFEDEVTIILNESEMQDWLVVQKIVQEILKEDKQKKERLHEQEVRQKIDKAVDDGMSGAVWV